jgi:maleate cis-trans isomerase
MKVYQALKRAGEQFIFGRLMSNKAGTIRPAHQRTHEADLNDLKNDRYSIWISRVKFLI